MKIKDKITQSLASITVELQEISPDFYVIGASAMILSGIEVGETAEFMQIATLAKNIYGNISGNKRG